MYFIKNQSYQYGNSKDKFSLKTNLTKETIVGINLFKLSCNYAL